MNLLLITLLIIFGVILLTILTLKQLKFKKTSEDTVNAGYKRKYENADLRNYKLLFLALGLLVAFSVSSFVLNYDFPSDPELAKLKKPEVVNEVIYEETVNTEQKDPPKPKIEVPVVVELIPEEIIEKKEEEKKEDDKTPEPEFNLDDLTGDPSDNQGTGDAIEDNDVYFFATEMAKPPGGMDALEKFVSDETNKLFTSHDRDKWNNLPRGSYVNVSYVIEKDGSISNIEVLRGVTYPSLNEAVVKALGKQPKWTPAKNNGYNVRLRFTQRVRLK